MLYPEFYKIYKKALSVILILFPAYIISYFYLIVNLKSDFVPRLKHWCTISHDCNPYNFLVNQSLLVTIVSLIYIITLLTFLTVSSEYSNKTFDRIYIIKNSIFKMLAAKAIVCLCIIFIFLIGQFFLFKYLVTVVSQTYPDLFNGYQFTAQSDLLNIAIILFSSTLKIISFQYMLSVVSRRFSFIPVTIGLLGILSFLLPFSPYGFLVRTNLNHQLDFLLTDALLGFMIYLTISIVVIKIWTNKKFSFN